MNTKRYELKAEPFQLGPIEFQDGLYCVTTDKGQDDVWSRIGAPLWVTACGRDTAGLGWGRQVSWYSPDGRPQEAFIPHVHLLSDGREALMKLMDGGYRFNLGMKRQLIDYLNSKPTCDTFIRHDRLGWIPDTNNFMLGDGAVGHTNAVKYIYTGNNTTQSDVAGTLDEWRDEVAALCLGNSRLLLSTSLAFAGPLLRLTNQSSFGVHLVGPSSIGKSTAMLVAASVLGKPANKIQTWNATKVGLETTAGLFNDSTLFLDEIGQADPHVLGDTIYMLANGEGRARANADLSRRAKLQWRTTFLSNGEVDLEHSLASVGKRHKAGHDVRMINIEADTDRHGIFEELHGHPNGASLSKTLAERTTQYHGVAFRSFIEELTLDIDGAQAFVDEHRADMMRQLGAKECDGQVQRVADAFGLISAAGELANRFGITGWPAGSIAAVVEQLFRKWLAMRGTSGSLEEANIIEQLVDLLEGRHGQYLADGPNVTKLGETYGYTLGPDLHLYVYGFKKTFAGFNTHYVHKVLRKHGILTHGTGRDLPRHSQSRVYQLSLDMIADAHDRLLAEQGEE
ncbi:DUF927 domain-containing protein [Aeromonas allosaccharophila]|uniref:DUF927 domain-containing protein n=1 Tax=Aeromonas allosaccharophila TaxID=656 RepID=UPI001BCD3013|nr:DUF927 domain-containing protein [Aeromonas allosaccharophila]MBS4696002.1 DUF927 domain-containing protein [Aeromonas allosaccharophila]